MKRIQFHSGDRDRSVCSGCSRTVRMVPVGNELVAVDPEVILVVTAAAHGGTSRSASVVPGRRPHAETCESYQRDARRTKTRKDMIAYNKRHRKGGL